MIVRFNDIIIPKFMLMHKPRPEKVEKFARMHLNGENITKDIVLTSNNELVDGYARYIALLCCTDYYFVNKEIDVQKHIYTNTYIYGKHKPNGKTYVWRVTTHTKHQNRLAVGKYAVVKTSNGKSIVEITKIYNTKARVAGTYKIKDVFTIL